MCLLDINVLSKLTRSCACDVTAVVVQIYRAEANLGRLDNFTFQEGKDALEAAAREFSVQVDTDQVLMNEVALNLSNCC
jgi:hypothetical protein